MADRGIIFSIGMVCALLDGAKTQTRRVINPRGLGAPVDLSEHGVDVSHFDYSGRADDPMSWGWPGAEDGADAQLAYWPEFWGYAAGDRLWVREGWAEVNGATVYRADHREAQARGPRVDVQWRSSRFMPRRASRLTLTVTEVRVQRLLEISEADARAEGAMPILDLGVGREDLYRVGFQQLWDHLHGRGASALNPWVVAVTFTVGRHNIDAPP